MDDLDTKLTAALQRLAEAKTAVERQRGLIVTRKELQLSTEAAENMPVIFLGTLSCMEYHTQRIQSAVGARNAAALESDVTK